MLFSQPPPILLPFRSLRVSPDVLERPTWAAFIALLDNYEASAGKAERVTNEERHEESRFMDCIFHQVHDENSHSTDTSHSS